MLPNVLQDIVIGYLGDELKLLDWIDESHLCWNALSGNPAAIHLLEKNLDKINWYILSGNHAAIHLLEKYPDRIDWRALSSNPVAIHLLKKYPDRIYWQELSRNPGIFYVPNADIRKLL